MKSTGFLAIDMSSRQQTRRNAKQLNCIRCELVVNEVLGIELKGPSCNKSFSATTRA
jgi:hypothetical protein